MDVGDPSNFARILSLFNNSHDAIVAQISGATYNDTQIAETIKNVYDTSGYVLDPHGACGYKALADSLNDNEIGVFLETAHPAKFKNTVEKIIDTDINIPNKLQTFMNGTKRSTVLSASFNDLKTYLLKSQ
jgi:threonine synthase